MACHIKKSSGSLKKCIVDVLWKLVRLDLWTLCITTVQYFTASLLRTQGAGCCGCIVFSASQLCCQQSSHCSFCIILCHSFSQFAGKYLLLLRQFWCLQYKAIYDWLRSDMFFVSNGTRNVNSVSSTVEEFDNWTICPL